MHEYHLDQLHTRLALWWVNTHTSFNGDLQLEVLDIGTSIYLSEIVTKLEL